MSMKKLGILTAMAALSSTSMLGSMESNIIPRFSGGYSKAKTNLTKKQSKRRAKSKLSKQARKRNR